MNIFSISREKKNNRITYSHLKLIDRRKMSVTFGETQSDC
jgi:hypothetical protein